MYGDVCSITAASSKMSAQDVDSIARLSPHNPNDFSIQQSQTVHRLALLQHWNIPSGSTVLELGCGQGDCTTVLANAVGEQGRVVAVDPAGLDYGMSSGSMLLVPASVLPMLGGRVGPGRLMSP